jgi:23S rRNA (pseudouridine1915-N3)-methyltransferase
MKITLLFTGKTRENYLKEGIAIYTKRLGRYIPFEIAVLNDGKSRPGNHSGKSKSRDSSKQPPYEGNTTFLVLLDQKGEKFSSESFAGFIQNTMNKGYKELAFMTGGAYGFPDNTYETADKIISLSDMTFSNQMVRLILAEQIYRAMTIIRGEPYHHQ